MHLLELEINDAVYILEQGDLSTKKFSSLPFGLVKTAISINKVKYYFKIRLNTE